MEAAAQRIESGKSTVTSAALEKATQGLNAVKTFFVDRLQYAVGAFHDTLEGRKFRATEAIRLSQIKPVAKVDARIAALLLCTTSSRVIEIREGLNHFKATEHGIQPSSREEYLQSAGAPIYELKVEGDQLQAWTTTSAQASVASTNDTMTVLNGNFFVKVLPFELRGSAR